MINENLWVLWRISTQEKLDGDNFEYSLILENVDNSLEKVIEIDGINSHSEDWLELIYEKAPFGDLINIDIPVKDDLSLFSCCFINVKKLMKQKPQLAHIYLWASARNKQIQLETVYPLSELQDVVKRHSNKFFVQMYPKIPSEKYVELEDQIIEAQSLAELLVLIRGNNEDAPLLDKEGQASAVMVEDAIKNIFSKQDLKDLVEGLNEWQRAHGKNELIDKLPESLLNKIGEDYEIAFWTSGQGVSNMVRDNNPPRHTMVLSIIQKSSQDGIGYCIQRPTSLDKVWTHKKWHRIKYSDSEILEVSALEC